MFILFLVWFGLLLGGHILGNSGSLRWSYVLCVFRLFVILVISRFGFDGWIWVLIASVPGLCILFTSRYLDGDVPCRRSNGVYTSQIIQFARVCSHVNDFNARNKCLTVKLLKQRYRHHKLRKAFSKFYHRHHEMVSKFNVGLKPLLHQGLSEPEFHCT